MNARSFEFINRAGKKDDRFDLLQCLFVQRPRHDPVK